MVGKVAVEILPGVAQSRAFPLTLCGEEVGVMMVFVPLTVPGLVPSESAAVVPLVSSSFQ